jgi:YegS/Rv2252/BmrU family lipid kinase
MTSGRFVFVVNPRSANGATLKRFERVRAQFSDVLKDMDVKLTTHPRHATELAREAVRAGAKAVVAVGGDGTNNEVVNGFFDDKGEKLPGETAFGVVTSGTGGDFRRTFGWSTEPLDDLARLARFKTLPIDVGRLRVTTDAGEKIHMFVNIASVGVSADVVDVVNHSSKALGAKLSFLTGTVRAMLKYQPQRVAITIEDGAPVERDITFIAVANAQYFGGSMWVAPQAKPDDGLFDVVTVTGGGIAFFVKNASKLYAGEHTSLPVVHVERARSLKVVPVGGARVLVEIDGEQPGRLPATFEVVPGALPLLV